VWVVGNSRDPGSYAPIGADVHAAQGSRTAHGTMNVPDFNAGVVTQVNVTGGVGPFPTASTSCRNASWSAAFPDHQTRARLAGSFSRTCSVSVTRVGPWTATSSRPAGPRAPGRSPPTRSLKTPECTAGSGVKAGATRPTLDLPADQAGAPHGRVDGSTTSVRCQSFRKQRRRSIRWSLRLVTTSSTPLVGVDALSGSAMIWRPDPATVRVPRGSGVLRIPSGEGGLAAGSSLLSLPRVGRS
jgi:hypothetical protein